MIYHELQLHIIIKILNSARKFPNTIIICILKDKFLTLNITQDFLDGLTEDVSAF